MSNSPLVNRGTGAGGANTNKNGKSFEEKTNNESRLLAEGFVRKDIPKKKGKSNYYLEKTLETSKSIGYLTQGGLKTYFATFFNKEIWTQPDEAYIFRDGEKYAVKILEKKNQNGAGSVDTKLWTGSGYIDQYNDMLGEGFDVKYAFCLSDFLKQQYTSDQGRWKSLRKTNAKHGIVVLFGDDSNYYETLDAWLSS